ncbi:hypothetical protein IU449_16170 [Nocardia higoensis]|uniref:Uncharacterized protein n=1 Tax=Nocardia higoensis TaxID=228599 RepID=A0ABS0DC94_9NOCA|nr:hypothetical protein [Nocardia higoensis]MBF6356059.1 hypothetical protein [Nocardia higoensis]
MGTDEQLGLDFEVQRTAWGDWVDPERRTAQARKFMDRAGVTRIPNTPWAAGSPEVKRLDALVTQLFPNMETAMRPENSDAADEFICFVGECYIKFARAQWFDFEWRGREHSFYDSVNPALRWLVDDDEDEEVTAWALMEGVANHSKYGDGFSLLADEMREEHDRIAGSIR